LQIGTLKDFLNFFFDEIRDMIITYYQIQKTLTIQNLWNFKIFKIQIIFRNFNISKAFLLHVNGE
jgi:hypothetical protein